jgi:ABC-type transport system involved in cytochrome c biogenesis ATPase subunit
MLLEEHVAQGGIVVVATHQVIEVAGGMFIDLRFP